MKGLQIGAAVVLAVLVASAGAWVIHARRSDPGTLSAVMPLAALPRAPEGVRIRVQVLNTTGVHGLARRATRLLRDRGFDVVEMGNGSPQLDTTLVLDRSGHPAWAAAVSGVLRPSRTEARPDSSRYLDVTVLLGRTWRPPAKPFDP
jgi:hypothetical protein